MFELSQYFVNTIITFYFIEQFSKYLNLDAKLKYNLILLTRCFPQLLYSLYTRMRFNKIDTYYESGGLSSFIFFYFIYTFLYDKSVDVNRYLTFKTIFYFISLFFVTGNISKTFYYQIIFYTILNQTTIFLCNNFNFKKTHDIMLIIQHTCIVLNCYADVFNAEICPHMWMLLISSPWVYSCQSNTNEEDLLMVEAEKKISYFRQDWIHITTNRK